MKKHFKEQLEAGPANGSPDFKVFYILDSGAGSKAVHTVDNHSVDNLAEDLEYVEHAGAIPVLTPKV